MEELLAYTELKSITPNPYFPGVEDVNAQEVLERKSDLVLIDVREPAEFSGDLGHVAGSELVPLGGLPENMNRIPKDKTVIFICRSGNRSAHAAAYAKELGFSSVYNMMGGMLFWNQILLPVER